MLGVNGFDLRGDLPSGTVVLEASAGTGKTHTIAALVTRWVAETDLRLPRVLVVTFTRAATGELRGRIRRRLVEATDHLEAAVTGARPATDDDVLSLLTDVDAAERRRRLDRLRRALSDIDAATISTIHGFCQHVLDGLGLAGDLDRDAALVEDHRELVEQVTDDLVVRTFLDHPPAQRPRRSELLELAMKAVHAPTTPLTPVPRSGDGDGDGSDDVAQRVRFAEEAREEVARRALRQRVLSYDDLLTRLHETLQGPRGASARTALRQRYHVALIDEFQDTDPIQWEIVRRAFGEPGPDSPPAGGPSAPPRALVLIGDPKQAIYGFRGADVYAYLAARSQARRQETLATNWRTDAPLLRALDAAAPHRHIRGTRHRLPHGHARPRPRPPGPRRGSVACAAAAARRRPRPGPATHR